MLPVMPYTNKEVQPLTARNLDDPNRDRYLVAGEGVRH